MKNVLTFMLAQTSTACVATGLFMAVANLAIWGAPIAVGIVFGSLAIMNHNLGD